MTEKEKMMAGKIYDPSHEELVKLRTKAHRLSKEYNELLEKNVRYISSDICQAFQTYDWPGNIREIEHIVAFRMSVIRPDEEKLEFSDLERKWVEITGKKKQKTELPVKDLKTMVEEYEKSVIEKVLEMSMHNITKASLILKIPRQTLQRKIKQYEL